MSTESAAAFVTRLVRLLTTTLAAAAVLCPAPARADTVASLLGNFTVNQYGELRLDRSTLDLHYVVVFGQLPALRELHLADADGDGVTTQQERDAYVAKLAPEFARNLVVEIDGRVVPLQTVQVKTSLPTEASGFSMRLDIDYRGSMPAIRDDAASKVRFANDNYAGRLGWHELVVKAAPSLAAYDTDAFDSSLTNGLQDALQSLPASGPLDERTVHLSIVAGSAPAGARPIEARGQTAAPVASSPRTTVGDAASGEWLQVQTRRLVGLISAPTVSPPVMLLALLAAVVLGALHAFSPGHGKTIVGAYLVGSRSTPRHAIFLGLTVTITHTLVVFAVGLLTLFASRFILPERLFPILSLLSGLLVLGMGLVLLRQRWPAFHLALAQQLVRWFERREARGRAATARAASTSVPLRAVNPLPQHAPYGMRRSLVGHAHAHAHGPGGHAHAHGAPDHPHTHDDAHSHGHAHDHHHGPADAGTLHSHGGTMHSHLPPGASGEPVSWRSLLALGVSGGLVPCPSAMVLLLAAIALNKTAYGLLMVVAFSVGLALTLIAVGFVFLHARTRFGGKLGTSGLAQMLPAISGIFITLVGVVLCYGALTTVGFGSLRG